VASPGAKPNSGLQDGSSVQIPCLMSVILIRRVRLQQDGVSIGIFKKSVATVAGTKEIDPFATFCARQRVVELNLATAYGICNLHFSCPSRYLLQRR